jgi:hypothetical protein
MTAEEEKDVDVNIFEMIHLIKPRHGGTTPPESLL